MANVFDQMNVNVLMDSTGPVVNKVTIGLNLLVLLLVEEKKLLKIRNAINILESAEFHQIW